jgi:ferritin-like metal-binding protein YciE
MSRAKDLESKLHEYLIDTHAMEKQVLRQLDELISTTEDEELRGALERHRTETEQQIDRLEARLVEHYLQPAVLKTVSARLALLFKALADVAGEDRLVKNARDAFVTEQLEIAAYELLERVAQRAGDRETAQIARENRAEEEAMASAIAAGWDRVIDETLAQDGVLAATDRSATSSTMPATESTTHEPLSPPPRRQR